MQIMATLNELISAKISKNMMCVDLIAVLSYKKRGKLCDNPPLGIEREDKIPFFL